MANAAHELLKRFCRQVEEEHSPSDALIDLKSDVLDYLGAADDLPKEENFINYYRCPGNLEHRTQHEPLEWSDEWSCQCNDKCPQCNAEIEPYESEDA